MAKLRIFVSSTCYDLDILRSELRPFIIGMGYEPVMSDYSDILYDPRSHTHDSCIKEVPSCDMVLLVVGSRFGGQAVPSAIEDFDFTILEQMSTKAELMEHKDKLSITQLEVLKAVEQSIPVYAFVNDEVMHDHHVYEKNKDKKEVIDSIEFPSIPKRETAKYIFEFINFLGHRTKNNSITPFARLDDIKSHLLSQWSQLFQRILFEGRTKAIESRRYQDFSEQLGDLKAVIMASISTPNLRETARGAIQYRHLVTFILSLDIPDHRSLLVSAIKWEEVLNEAKIVEIREDVGRAVAGDVYLIKDDRTFYKCRYPLRFFKDMKVNWGSFIQLNKDTRTAIIDALAEDSEIRRQVRYVNEDVDEYIESRELLAASPNDLLKQFEVKPGGLASLASLARLKSN